LLWKAMRRPSGDQEGNVLTAGSLVTIRGWLPSTPTTQISRESKPGLR
jgi:hypothetical protein